MSSAGLVSLRHTATESIYQLIKSLIGVAIDENKELESCSKQTGAEEKKSKPNKSTMKQFDDDMKASKKNIQALEMMIFELFDRYPLCVFLMRVKPVA